MEAIRKTLKNSIRQKLQLLVARFHLEYHGTNGGHEVLVLQQLVARHFYTSLVAHTPTRRTQLVNHAQQAHAHLLRHAARHARGDRVQQPVLQQQLRVGLVVQVGAEQLDRVRHPHLRVHALDERAHHRRGREAGEPSKHFSYASQHE